MFAFERNNSEEIDDNKFYEYWKSNFDSDYHEPQEYLEYDEVSSNTGRLEPKKYEFCDELFNSDETGREYAEYGLSVNKTDTHDVGSIPGLPAGYKCYGDNEFLAMMAANKATENKSAKKENDWAFPGEQTCVPIKTMKARWDLAQSNKVNLNSAVQRRKHHAEARRRGGSMDFLMESGFMHWMSERMSFTNWVKADFHETSRITLKFSAPPRLRVRYRLGAGSSRYGNCFF